MTVGQDCIQQHLLQVRLAMLQPNDYEKRVATYNGFFGMAAIDTIKQHPIPDMPQDLLIMFSEAKAELPILMKEALVPAIRGYVKRPAPPLHGGYIAGLQLILTLEILEKTHGKQGRREADDRLLRWLTKKPRNYKANREYLRKTWAKYKPAVHLWGATYFTTRSLLIRTDVSKPEYLSFVAVSEELLARGSIAKSNRWPEPVLDLRTSLRPADAIPRISAIPLPSRLSLNIDFLLKRIGLRLK